MAPLVAGKQYRILAVVTPVGSQPSIVELYSDDNVMIDGSVRTAANTTSGVVPSSVVDTLHPTIVPGDSGTATVTIKNESNSAQSGNVTVTLALEPLKADGTTTTTGEITFPAFTKFIKLDLGGTATVSTPFSIPLSLFPDTNGASTNYEFVATITPGSVSPISGINSANASVTESTAHTGANIAGVISDSSGTRYVPSLVYKDARQNIRDDHLARLGIGAGHDGPSKRHFAALRSDGARSGRR